MPHHFRTIEAFVQLLEQQREGYFKEMKTHGGHSTGAGSYWSGKRVALGEVLQILRTSNIGIVYPPPEQERKNLGVCTYCPDVTACTSHGECLSSGRNMNRAYGGIEPNGTRCPDCGLPCDHATGEHRCSDGQVRGFRVSP